MQRIKVEELTAALITGRISQAEFVAKIAAPATAELGDVTLDLDRFRRCGFAEVVFGQSKSVETLTRIFRRLLEEQQPVLATRIEADKATELSQQFPAGRYNPVAQTFRIDQSRPLTPSGPAGNQALHAGSPSRSEGTTIGLVAIVTAG